MSMTSLVFKFLDPILRQAFCGGVGLMAVELSYHLCVINLRKNIRNARNVVTLLNLTTMTFFMRLINVLVWQQLKILKSVCTACVQV
jgi:hypothetical protein